MNLPDIPTFLDYVDSLKMTSERIKYTIMVTDPLDVAKLVSKDEWTLSFNGRPLSLTFFKVGDTMVYITKQPNAMMLNHFITKILGSGKQFMVCEMYSHIDQLIF